MAERDSRAALLALLGLFFPGGFKGQLTAQTNAANQGILVRSGRALEMLAQADTIVFDKTATLTEGRVRVVEVRTLRHDIEPRALLCLAASRAGGIPVPINQQMRNDEITHVMADSGATVIVRSAHDVNGFTMMRNAMLSVSSMVLSNAPRSVFSQPHRARSSSV